MDRVRQLIHEIHRRSLWQVLGIYVGASWVVFEVAQTLTEGLGLPDWVPPVALILLLVGLPVVLATAFVQEGIGRDAEMPGPPSNADSGSDSGSVNSSGALAPLIAGVLTWKNALLGGVLAFAGLGVVVAGYWVLWATGTGPVGSLVAQGVLEEADAVVLADFENVTDDPLLGDLVTSTLRIDLVESPLLTVVEPTYARQVLRRMDRSVTGPISAAVAREIAVREGFKAVIQGEVRSAGSAYVLSSTVVRARDGRALAAFRVVAEGEDDLIEAIDELSQDIRERVGESLRSIRAEPPLETVTTSSLQALRKYTQGVDASFGGDDMAALSLFEEAIELDPRFAMAHRQIAVMHSNAQMDPLREIESVTRAYELRHRLSDRERHLVEAYYHWVLGDIEASIQAHRTVLRFHPDDARALVNLGIQYIRRGEIEAAQALLRRAVDGPGETPPAHAILVRSLFRLERLQEAASALVRFESRYPETSMARESRYWLHFFRGEYRAADSVAESLAHNPGFTASWRARGHRLLSATDLFHGRVREATEHIQDATLAASELGPTPEYFEAWNTPIVKLRLGLDEGRGMGLFEALDDLWHQMPAVRGRPYLWLAMHAAVANEPGRAREYLEAWETEVPEALRTRPRSATRKRVAEGLIAWRMGDPEKGLDLIDQGQRTFGCSDCVRFWRTLVVSESGTPREVVDALEERANTVFRFSVGGLYPNAREWPLAYERLCHLYAQREETAKAVDYCERFAEIWADADPELQPRVRAAAQGLKTLAQN